MLDPAALQRDPGYGTGDATLDLPGNDGCVRARVFLHAGEVYASVDPTSVITVLGSCIAVCLYDPVARIGGVNHFLLPHHTARERSSRFGSVAMAELFAQVIAAGGSRVNFQAKVFGGASVLQARRASTLGRENAELALHALAAEGVTLVEQDLGGGCARKLVFHTDVGNAWVRHL